MTSKPEQTTSAKRVMRLHGYDHGFREQKPYHPQDAEYMKSYRRGAERRAQLRDGKVIE